MAFDEYMELVLYHPRHGYYSGDKPRYGRHGDFLTAPTASEWYARVLTRLLMNFAADAGPVRLIDVASGDGAVITGVLEALGPNAAEVLGELFRPRNHWQCGIGSAMVCRRHRLRCNGSRMCQRLAHHLSRRSFMLPSYLTPFPLHGS